ncbi:M56 family metallopeptidase [Mucilaginibacter sp. PAMB04274]|uniref:M56 family metallopeptidase n=1 Tax=Mucilaginibacter sp. PAMB04274 TaxID=3138568 RepID=UPI0031F5F1B3
MPALLIYLLKVNIALLLFCLGYYAVLRKLTFYTLNRVYLITAILFSSIYPQIDLSNMMQHHQKLVEPLQIVVINLNSRAAVLAKPIAHANYWEWVIVVFWIGVSVMALRLAIQFWSLYRIYHNSKPANLNNQKVRVIADEVNPFSFWQSIFINPRHHAAEELHSIIAHEQVHIKQWHTLDILLAELSLMFYWFNPGVWLMKKAVSENLEFITDRNVLQKGTDVKSYQYSLLYASFNTSPNAMVNHFNISTIKKRIMMMNSKKSSAFSLTRYSFIAPAVLVLLLAFGTSKAALIRKGYHAVKAASNKVIAIATEATTYATASNQTVIKPVVKPVTIRTNTSELKGYRTELNQTVDTTFNDVVNQINISNDTPKVKGKLVLGSVGVDSAYYLINGKPISSKTALGSLNPNAIHSVNVLHGTAATSLFGEKAKNGAVLIVTKDGINTPETKEMLEKVTSSNSAILKSSYNSGSATRTAGVIGVTTKHDTSRLSLTRVTSAASQKMLDSLHKSSPKGQLKEVAVMGYATPRSREPLTLSFKNPNSAANPLILINGKEATNEDMKGLNPNSIKSIDIIKDSAITTQYGAKASYGIIKITTQESTKSTPKK